LLKCKDVIEILAMLSCDNPLMTETVKTGIMPSISLLFPELKQPTTL